MKKNMKTNTTIVGAALAVLYYLSEIGADWPQTRAEWGKTLVSAGLLALGYYAKSIGLEVPSGNGPSNRGRKLRALVVLLAPLALTGCSGVLGQVGQSSPEQLAELAKVKDSACSKITGVYMGATVNITSVSVDKGVLPAGRQGVVKISPDCATEITQTGKE